MQSEDVCSYTAGNTSAWESENDWPIAELIADMYQALDRLECPSAGHKSSSRGFISVRRHCFVWSLVHVWCTITHTPCQLLSALFNSWFNF